MDVQPIRFLHSGGAFAPIRLVTKARGQKVQLLGERRCCENNRPGPPSSQLRRSSLLLLLIIIIAIIGIRISTSLISASPCAAASISAAATTAEDEVNDEGKQKRSTTGMTMNRMKRLMSPPRHKAPRLESHERRRDVRAGPLARCMSRPRRQVCGLSAGASCASVSCVVSELSVLRRGLRCYSRFQWSQGPSTFAGDCRRGGLPRGLPNMPGWSSRCTVCGQSPLVRGFATALAAPGW